MTDLSRRIPHVFPRADLALLLAPTYADALAVDEDIATERLGRALADAGVLASVHDAIAAALEEARGPRTDPDAQLDRISRGLQARRWRVKAVAATPAVSAAMIWMNLAIGLAPESMRETLASGRGREMLAAGLRAIAASLVKDLGRGASPAPS